MSSQNNSLLINTSLGPVLGFQDTYPLSDRSTANQTEIGSQSPVNKWLGIPYAQAERWKRPSPPMPWKEPLTCHEFGPHFPQGMDVSMMLYSGKPGFHPRAWRHQSEEKAFNLNIFTPEGTQPDDKLPVLVWIYGGALIYGSAGTILYDPTEWIRRESSQDRRFIVVTGNYRVNIFGFLSSSDLNEEDKDGLSGNYGAYDCIAYLQWVQENISKFGGDPENVTAFGESAGGMMISCLLLVQKKLFKRAILQSGFPGTMPLIDLKTADSLYHGICQRASIEGSSGTERLSSLRALSTDQLLTLIPPAMTSHSSLGFTIETSSNAIWSSTSVTEILKTGKWSPHVKSVMLGVTKDESTMFTSLFQAHTPGGYDFLFQTILDNSPRGKVDKLYDALEFEDPSTTKRDDLVTYLATRVLNDKLFHVPSRLCANVLSSHTHFETHERLAVYVYQLNATVAEIDDGRGMGAFHTIDIPFIFNLKEAWTSNPENEKTSELMGRSWSNFAISGAPDPTWPKYSPEKPLRKVFEMDGSSSIEDLSQRSELEKSRYDYWIQFC